MDFTIAERIALSNILPPEGNVVTLRIVRELQMQLAFDEREIKEYKIKNHTHPDGRLSITWDGDFTTKAKDVSIGDVAKGIIVEQLKKLSSGNMLRLEMLDLYDKFVDGKGTENLHK
jgi:hypothetical protein